MRDAVRRVGRVGDEEVGASGVQAACQVDPGVGAVAGDGIVCIVKVHWEVERDGLVRESHGRRALALGVVVDAHAEGDSAWELRGDLRLRDVLVHARVLDACSELGVVSDEHLGFDGWIVDGVARESFDDEVGVQAGHGGIVRDRHRAVLAADGVPAGRGMDDGGGRSDLGATWAPPFKDWLGTPGANVEADTLGFGGTHFPGIRCHVLMTSPLSSSSSSRYGMSTETLGAK